MDPDEIPQRLEGESMEEYRARLADELIERMIDPNTGEIRAEVRDDPELRQYAEWAKARFDEREALEFVDVATDPDATPEQVQAHLDTLERRTGFNGIQQADQEMSAQGHSASITAERSDEIRETEASQASTSSELDAFGL